MRTSSTIAEVLTQFLAEQEPRLSARTFARYENVAQLLQHYLNGYAYEGLDERAMKHFERLYRAKGDAHREFCEIFGPEYILPNIDMFLNDFMIRKVGGGQDLMRAAGTVTKKLAFWLAEHGHIEASTTEVAVEVGAAAVRDLPKTRALLTRLQALTERFTAHREVEAILEAGPLLHPEALRRVGGEPPPQTAEEVEDHFWIRRIEASAIWLQGMIDGRELGPIQLPQDIVALCTVGWTIAGVVGRVGNDWQLVDVWNVYPS